MQEALAAWVAQGVKAERPATAVLQRLFRTLDGPERYRPFFAALQDIFDLSQSALRNVLARLDETSGWSLHGEARYFHFTPGPRLATQEAGVVRMAPGVVFPRHRHRAGEVTFVIDGLMNDRDRLYGPGSVVEADPGTTHDYRSAGVGRDLILLSRHGGIEFP
jgi:quercetin dioxygenase-like cupin family protein